MITYTNTVQSYHDHPDRFDHYLQVLCRESVCGRCYWELEWSGGDYGVRISVSYKSISRKGSGKMCCLEIMISPGVCTAIPPDTHSYKITYGLISL